MRARSLGFVDLSNWSVASLNSTAAGAVMVVRKKAASVWRMVFILGGGYREALLSPQA
jgi:hypothetical protein